MSTVFITGINSDIGLALCKRLQREKKYKIVGTYRTFNSNTKELASMGIDLVPLDLASENSTKKFCEEFDFSSINAIYFLHGTLNPIGIAGSLDYSSWETSFRINYLSIVQILLEAVSGLPNGSRVISLAGGGVNSAPINFSAYITAKISLIKLTELLAAEYSRLLFFNVGPGWVDTKIHQQTIEAKHVAECAYKETIRRYANNQFVSMDKVVDVLEFFLNSSNSNLSGRNYSVAGDNIGEQSLRELIHANNDVFKLRRFHGN
ncbi:SDR family oxidoreductase [Catenovulum sediminis]|uniref:SDR family oxidoreductase n=1 Tax=Catenovulum sediminis TaxID=1740262 RepID=A0ABV1RGX5_9ALTE